MSSYPYRSFDKLRTFPKSTSGTKYLFKNNYPVTFKPNPEQTPVEAGIVTSWVAVPEMLKSYWQSPLDSPSHTGCTRCQKSYPDGCPLCRFPGNSQPQGACLCGQKECVCRNMTMGPRVSPISLNTGMGCGCQANTARERSAGGCNCANGDKGGCGCGSKKFGSLSLLDPKFNLREVCKHCVLLEDHLFQREKRCNDCIKKHLLTMEAFLEEAVTLDKIGQLTPIIETVLQALKQATKDFVNSGDYTRLAQNLRDMRKNLMGRTDLFECAYK